jgi:hypothetical protein
MKKKPRPDEVPEEDELNNMLNRKSIKNILD